MKRIIALILVICMVMAMLSACNSQGEPGVQGEKGEQGDKGDKGLSFMSNGDGTCYVSGIGTCTDTDLVIPPTSPNGDKVTGIGVYAFYNCSMLTSIAIPNSVNAIGQSAFSFCSNLTSITIPDSVTTIGEWAFDGCTNLTSITIPDSVTTIGDYAFLCCSSLASINVDKNNPNYCSINGNLYNKSATELIRYAMADTTFIIPDSVTTIREGAFYYCSSLASVTIPDSVTTIGEGTFGNCSSLTTINYNGTMEEWKAIEKGSNWNESTGSFTIHCTDGDLGKND